MKNFDVANFGRLNLQATIGGKTYSDKDFTLTGVTSFSKGDQTSATGTLTLRGAMPDFLAHVKEASVRIDIIGNSGAEEYMTLYIKHPVQYDGQDVVLEVDTLPPKSLISYTDTLGNQLPFSFGRPWVKAVPISRRFVGTVLEDFHQITLEEINDLMNAYLECVRALFYARVSGVAATDEDESKLKNIHIFSSMIQSLSAKAPNHRDTLHKFYELLYYYGDTTSTVTSLQAQNLADDNPLKDVLEQLGLYTCLYDTFPNGCLPVITLAGSAYMKNVDFYRNPLKSSLSYKTAYEIWQDVKGWASTVTVLPTSIAVDLGDFEGQVQVKHKGVIIAGAYANNNLAISWYGAKDVDIRFDIDTSISPYIYSGAGHPYKVRTTGFYDPINLEGKYVKVRMVAQRSSEFGGNYDIQYVTRVVHQDGKSLTLEHLPYFDNSEGNVGFNPFDEELVGFGGRDTSIFMRAGTISKYADTPEALVVGESNLEQFTDTAPIGFEQDKAFGHFDYIANSGATVIGAAESIHEIHSFVITTEVENYRRKAQKDVAEINVAGYDEITYYEEDGEPVTRWKTTAKEAIVYNASLPTFSLDLNIGDPLELDDDFVDVFIVDVRPNITITGVKSKIGDNWVEIPSSYYDIDYTYLYEGHTMTALLFKIPLEDRVGGFTRDIKVAVDTGVYDVLGMASYLASGIGRGAVSSSDYTTFSPNFTVYGYTPILNTLSTLARQTLSGFFFSGSDVKLVRLEDDTPTSLATLNSGNIEKCVVKTSDILDLLNVTTYSWENLKNIGNSVVVKLDSRPDSLTEFDSKDVVIYDDKAQAVRWSKWDVHRNGRLWVEAEVTGFIDSLNLEPYDIVTVDHEGVNTLAEVQSVDYDHDTASVAVHLILNRSISHSSATLWHQGTDIIVEPTSLAYGYSPLNNQSFLDYYGR